VNRLLPVACAVGMACRPISQLPLDTTLPDGEPIAAAPPLDILRKLAADTDPDTRAIALTGLAHAPALAAERSAWVERGLYDPDPWVQRAMVASGLEDATLDAYAVMPSADATTRAHVAFERLAHGATFPLDAFDVGSATAKADRVPLGLVRVALGDAAAKATVASTIDHGDLRDDAMLLAALATHGWPELSAALVGAERWVEPDAIARMQVVRARLGDPDARAAWRSAVRADASVGWDLAELVAALPDADRAALARDLSSVGDKALRDALAVLAHPSAAAVRHAIESDDPTARDLGFQGLKMLPVADAVALVRAAVRADDPWTWASASRAASDAGLCALQDTFATRLQDDRNQVRAAAAAVIARCDTGTAP
jgi:hypothetical protein